MYNQKGGVSESSGSINSFCFYHPFLHVAAKEGVVAFSIVSKPQLDTGKELITASLDSLHVDLYVSTK